ncbi:uncharacterized protein LOC134837564 [Culicoides brevitarsis]|uniref:uncharacterized protein LOC134837564 n=1 Tax=Culicoides brevitarsis TaxID=469753 RepID=UPI00307C10FE
MKIFFVSLIAVLTIFTQLKDADAWLLPCDETIELKAGDNITLKSPNNPVGSAGSLCRYKIKAPQGFTITATCKLKIHQHDNGKCSSESFHVMKNGSTDLLGSEIICGKGKITRTSRFNELTLVYKSEINSGKFSCSITTNCDCGWSVKSKVVNGEIAEVNEFISMAGIVDLKFRSVECGGGIISPFYVLSAAHCFSHIYPEHIGVLVGDHDHSIGQETTFAALYLVQEIIKHENFNPQTDENDIALVKTKTEIKFNIAVGPACLPYVFPEDHFDNNFVLEAAGWGTTSFMGQVSSVLRTVDLNTMNYETCNEIWQNIKTLTPRNVTAKQLCTFTEGQDTCKGDSGGNLYYRNNKLYTILIVSFGKGCANQNPAVNTKISAYLSWIEENAKDAFFLFLIFTGLLILAQLYDANAWLLPCDETINLEIGNKIVLNSPNNQPGTPGSFCRYQIKAPQGFTISASCKLKMQQDKNGKCSSESFYVMSNGGTDLTGSEIICGKGKFIRKSRFNELTLAYKSENNTGSFSCSITTNCDCGWSVKSKVVNGEIAEVNEFISMAGIVDLKKRSVECGGGIISPFHVVSAAHCYFDSLSNPSNVAILVGDHDHSIGQDTKFAALYLVEKITKHENYHPLTHVNDIALLKTSNEIKFNIAVGPACLPYNFAPNHFDSNFTLEAAGWGSTSLGGGHSKVLRTVELKTMDIETCRERWENVWSTVTRNITTNQVCTFMQGKDTCKGDSGSNLYYRNNKLYTVLLVSYGRGCANNIPAVNTKISAYLPWIEENTEGQHFCKA